MIENKNTACQSLATEQAVFQINGGTIYPVFEPMLADVAKNTTTSFFEPLKPKIRNNFDFKNEHETKAILLIQKIYHRKKLLPSLVFNNIYNLNYNIPNWEKLNKVDKLLGICAFMVNKREFLTFTLRFSKAFMKRAYKSKQDLTTYVADRISQNFKNNKGSVPKYMFAVENDKDVNGSFHIHGIIEATFENLDKVKHILKTTALGINYKKNPINRFALKFKLVLDSLGWLRYMTEDKQFGYNMIYVNRAITQEYKSFYNSMKYLN